MTDFWQGQRPWFAPENLRPQDGGGGENESPAGSPSESKNEAAGEPQPHRERVDDLMQRAIQRAYDR